MTRPSVLSMSCSVELSHISVSTGVDRSIKELTETVARFVGFDREIV